MKIFVLDDPVDEAFVEAGCRGKWVSNENASGQGVCPKCTASQQHRTPPLLLTWLPSRSHAIGDFIWAGPYPAVTDRAAKVLRDGNVGGFKLGTVEYVPPKGRLESAEVMGRRRPKFPHGAPRLRELIATRSVHYDRTRSSAKLSRPRCDVCGTERHDIERPSVEERITYGSEAGQRTPRLSGKGLFVKERDLEGDGLFMFEEFSQALLCTEPVRDLILEAGLTNIDFLEYGETF